MGRQTRKKLVGQTVTVDCGPMNYRGLFTAKAEGESLWFKGGIEGSSQEVTVQRVEGHRLRGTVSARAKTACEHFWDCGGCKLQHLPKVVQEKSKCMQVLGSLQELPYFQTLKDLPLATSERTHAYRNKMELSFSQLREGKAFGMHRDASFGQVLHTPNCILPLHPMQEVIKRAADWYLNSEVPGYNPYRHEGCLRYLVLRASENYKQVLVCIVATAWHESLSGLVDAIQSCESVQGILFSRHDGRSDAVVYEDLTKLFGDNLIRERLGRFVFELSIAAFFQVNTKGAEVLYDQIYQMLSRANALGGTLVDLYCGAGTIGIYLSDHFNKVIGVEEIESAVTNAKANACLNQVAKTEFIHAKVETLSSEVLREWGASVLILDPPRSGCHPKARARISSLGVRHLVYISCNPRNLPENLQEFLQAGYEIMDSVAVEMFPQTPHLELVVYLRLRE